MNDHPLGNLIRARNPRTKADYQFALRRVIQEISLLGLWRSGFFEYAAFYGGTALSLLHDLDRFSEDLDFSLLQANPDFTLKNYLDGVRRELTSWGIESEVGMITKTSGKIESAFFKTNTLETFLSLSIPAEIHQTLHSDEISKVKFEIDPDPPCSFASEFNYLLNPIPFSVRVMALPDLFAGKLHALLARKWQKRVKGRDWYDFIWFIRRGMKLNIDHLAARLKQSGHLKEKDQLTLPLLKEMLRKRIAELDLKQVRQDVIPFIRDSRQLENWTPELFNHLTDSLTT